MSSLQRELKWIREELIPSLVSDGKLKHGLNSKSTTLRSIEATRVSMEDSFMLSSCYKVIVKLVESTDESAETSVIKLVVKVGLL